MGRISPAVVAVALAGVFVLAIGCGGSTPPATAAQAGGCQERGGSRPADLPDLSDVDFDPPAVITQGGTYTGDWDSGDPDIPAVMIQTTERVVIDGSRIRGRGHLIEGVAGTRLTVQNSVGQALNPGVVGMAPGRFVILEDAADVRIRNNDLIGTAGIRLQDYTGDFRDDTYVVEGNRATDVDGRRSAGAEFSRDDSTADLVQFVQLVEVRGVPGIDIGWNEIHNRPGTSRVEDAISVYLSRGRPDSPISIHDNLVDGAYPTDPRSDPYSGGGIMLGDGEGPDGPAFVDARRNTVLNTTGHGIAVSAGTDITVRDNRIMSDGRLPNGDEVAAQNVGLYVANLYNQPEFGPVTVAGNVIGWERPASGDRNDSWTPDATDVTDNMPADGVGPAELRAEYDAWRCRAYRNTSSSPATETGG